MFNRKKEEVKTMHALGAMDYKNAKRAILNNPSTPSQKSMGEYKLDTNTFNEIVYIAREIMDKNKNADPQELIDRMLGNTRIKQLMKQGAINEGDIRDSLSAAI